MKAGSMEALIGASRNMKLVSTPMRIYKEAERKGDTATMERAMGYVTEHEQMLMCGKVTNKTFSMITSLCYSVTV